MSCHAVGKCWILGAVLLHWGMHWVVDAACLEETGVSGPNCWQAYAAELVGLLQVAQPSVSMTLATTVF
jgi:hypothetical protein